jgi:hypothetical protein
MTQRAPDRVRGLEIFDGRGGGMGGSGSLNLATLSAGPITGRQGMENRGLEPLTSAVRSQRSTS